MSVAAMRTKTQKSNQTRQPHDKYYIDETRDGPRPNYRLSDRAEGVNRMISDPVYSL